MYDNFSTETQRLLNLIKNEKDDNTSKQLIKEINLIQSIELKLLKLKSLKSNIKSVKSLKK
jgi:hypothetical protein